LRAGELRKNGSKLRLQEQPFQVLAALVEKPGEVVLREELKERLWADDTFVDFDHSLSTAINKIRQVLGDSATHPRFIETIPRRGYRFLAEVALDGPPDAAAEPPAPPKARLSRTAVASLVVLAIGATWFIASRVFEGGAAATAWSEPRRLTTDSGLTFQPTISRDGTLMAYSSDRAGEDNLDIWVQHTAGGEPIRITDDTADETAPHFSTDGKSIAFRSERGEGGVYVAPSLGGFERFVAPNGHRPRFSPDGQWIAYFTGPRGASSLLSPLPGGEAYVVLAAGGTPRRLAADAVEEMFPVWAPDGQTLLVATAQSTFDQASYEWRVVTLDGVDLGATGALAAIADSPARQTPGRVFPDHWDSDGYVYFSSRDADSDNLWRIRIQPQSARVVGAPDRVLAGPGHFYQPSISEDGRLAFASLTRNADMWSLAIDSDRGSAVANEAVRLTTAQGPDGLPSVSLDGARVAFQSRRSGKREVWLFDVASGHQRPLIEVPHGRPVVNVDGTRLVTGRNPWRILSSEGIVEQQLKGEGSIWDWSPDESLMLFNRLEGRHRAIILLDFDSGEKTRVVSHPEQSFFQGQFSPDMQWIAWMTGSGEMWLAPFQGAQAIPQSEWVRVPTQGAFADKPRWSPNGDLLYHTSDRDGFVCIYAQPLDPDTKAPRGGLLEIYHSHEAPLSIGNLGLPALELGVARDKIVFGMAELTGNIWMMEPLEQQ